MVNQLFSRLQFLRRQRSWQRHANLISRAESGVPHRGTEVTGLVTRAMAAQHPHCRQMQAIPGGPLLFAKFGLYRLYPPVYSVGWVMFGVPHTGAPGVPGRTWVPAPPPASSVAKVDRTVAAIRAGLPAPIRPPQSDRQNQVYCRAVPWSSWVTCAPPPASLHPASLGHSWVGLFHLRSTVLCSSVLRTAGRQGGPPG
jgi:hypothetical protein